jgi:hypothetical protein
MTSFLTYRSDVVIVRYTNDIDYMIYKFKRLGYNVIVYEKHPDMSDSHYFIPKNKGNEGSGYLKYIIDHYHNLPEHVVFLHDHETSWHHEGDIYDRVTEHLGHNINYYNLNNFIWQNDSIEWFSEINDWYRKYFYPEMGSMKKYGNFMTGYKGCAQFIVHKSLILKRSLKFYQDLYDWILTTPINDYCSSRFLEYTWHLMWEQVPKYNGIKQFFVKKYCKLINKTHPYGYVLKELEYELYNVIDY